MGFTRYPVLDDDFLLKMLGAYLDEEERGLVTVLDLTGMHVSSLCSLGSTKLFNKAIRHTFGRFDRRQGRLRERNCRKGASRPSKSS